MLLSALLSGNLQYAFIQLLLTLPVLLLALSAHEAAHGFIALKCGDPTARNLGRITLNPIKHFDLFGFISMAVFGYGWAKPVPINTRHFRKPKLGMALTAAAGPAANLLLGLISAILCGSVGALRIYLIYAEAANFLVNATEIAVLLFELSAIYNFLFMAFNLIPLPPFDGSRIFLIFLPTNTYFRLMQYERYIMFGVLITMMALSRFGFSPFSWIASFLTNGVSYVFYELFSILLKI